MLTSVFIYVLYVLQKKGNQAETKPFTNFSVFHSNLLTRLKQLAAIETTFSNRMKEAEARYSERIGTFLFPCSSVSLVY